jgi:hypothetical protein
MLPMEETLKGLTLYQIESELADLIAHRQERIADTEDPPSPDELAAIDGEIDRYHFAEPVKVTGVVAMFRQWKAQRANIKTERDRLKALDNMLEAMETRLKDRVAAALELLPQPAKGSRKLVGVDGSQLLLKGNGGLQPLQVDGWDEERRQWVRPDSPLPPDFELATVEMSGTLFLTLSMMKEYEDKIRLIAHVPNNKLIRETLAQPCGRCNATGRLFSAGDNPELCDLCGGSGKATVPGARLRDRGNHVEVR